MKKKRPARYIYHAPRPLSRPVQSHASGSLGDGWVEFGLNAPSNTSTPPLPARRSQKAWRALGRCGAVLGVTTMAVLLLAAGACAIFCLGPSPTARDIFVSTMLETSALKFVPRLFLDPAQIERALQKNTILETGGATAPVDEPWQPPADKPLDTIEIEEVTGLSFQGKMMIVYDPSRVKVACLDTFSRDAKGKKLSQYAQDLGAVAAINGGGFADDNGMGSGGMPLGIVIRDGKLLAGGLGAETSIVGFDGNDRLVVGRMTAAAALERGVRDAVSFGPAFIIDGEAADVAGSGGGLNPRTVIGQREDGAVLLLVIDGRQPHSLGATYKDCVEVMQQYGAVNAANLDGGSSTEMIYNGETLNVCASLYGPRALPTAFVVM